MCHVIQTPAGPSEPMKTCVVVSPQDMEISVQELRTILNRIASKRE